MPRAFTSRLPIVALAALTLGIALGGRGSTRLTYHEALVAQGAREMLARGDWLVPTINGTPWLEKPPLAHWLVALVSLPFGDVTETSARIPSALAALSICLVVAELVRLRFGENAGMLAGLVQASTYWTVLRGRLAESDILLASILAGLFFCLDRMRSDQGGHRATRLAFFALLGASALAKGIGFGGALALVSLGLILVWDRDARLLRSLFDPVGIALAAFIALAWPLLIVARHPEAVGLWTLHVSDRFADRPSHFASGPWWSYPAAALGLVLPWTPFALAGLVRSVRRAKVERFGVDRLLIAWAFMPLLILSFATVKNAHYAIHALPPWSAWTAVALVGVGERLSARGRNPRRIARALFGSLGLIYVAVFTLVIPRSDQRGMEWAYYARSARDLAPGESLVLLHDDWDRLPYPTPFGPIPHDLAVRLFYLKLDQPARIILSPKALPAEAPDGRFTVIARERDGEALRELGSVTLLNQGPKTRWDRSFVTYRVDRRKRDQAVPTHLIFR